MPRHFLLLFVALAGVSAGLFWFTSDWLNLAWLAAHRDDLIEACQRNLALAVAGLFLAFIVGASLFVPGAAVSLAITAGMVFGLWAGLVLTALASTLGALCAFLIARHLLHDWMHARFARLFAFVDARIARDGAFYLFLMRLIVPIPYFLMNPLMGLTDMRTRTFVLASGAGLAVNMGVWVNAGTMLAKIDSLDDVMSWEAVLALALIGALPLVVKRLAERVRANTTKV